MPGNIRPIIMWAGQPAGNDQALLASLFNPEAVSYRNARGIDHGEVHMAVVVQKMIRSEISGVTFTADPVSGSRDHIVTESSWGMGAAIVDGRVTPDHFVLGRENLAVIKKRVSNKRWLVPSHLPVGGRERLDEAPHDLRRKETLSSDQIREVTQWAIKAEEHFQGPQDVEWAITNGHYYMLQSRPITAMSREEIGRDVDGKYVLFKPAAENFTEPITPLTQDLIMRVVPGGMRFIKGWAYIDIDLVRAITPFKASDEETGPPDVRSGRQTAQTQNIAPESPFSAPDALSGVSLVRLHLCPHQKHAG